MRIASGVTDQYLYFVALDSTDYVSRETGLSSFTVYRSRNGGTAAAFTTPTVNETDTTNMPGVYELLLDEDTTIDSGDEEQEMVLHITHTGMAPVTRAITLFRPKVTAGETLTVSSGVGSASVASMGANTLTASALATDAVTEIQSGLATASALSTAQTDLDTITGSDGVTLATAQANYAPATAASLATAQADLDTITGTDGVTLATAQALYAPAKAGDAMDLITDAVDAAALAADAVAEINATVDTALADYDAPTKAELDSGLAALNDPTAAAIADAVWDEAIAGHAGVGSTGEALSGATAPTAAAVADAVWDEAIAGHLGAGSTGEALNAAGAAGDPWTTTLPGAYTGSQAGKMLSDIITDTAEIGTAGAGLTALASAANLATVDTVVDAILVDTAEIGTAGAGLTALATAANLATVDTVVDAILVDTAEIGVAGAGLTEAGGTGDQFTGIASVGAVAGAVGSVTGAVGSVTGAVGSVTGNVGGNVVGSVASVSGAVGSVTGNVGGSVGSLGATAKSDVNAEVVDALATDTYAEPGQGAPSATATLAAKLNFLYKITRNKKDNDGSTTQFYDDAGTTVDHKQTTSEAAGTVTKAEIVSGP